MFLNTIKSFLLNKTLKKQLCDVQQDRLKGAVKRVGLVVDESRFIETNALIQEIVFNGIEEENIEVIVYRETVKSNEVYSQPTFGLKDLNLKGEFTPQVINDFISEEFDLLISYYDEEKPFLMFLTHNSKAKFKVGFSSIDNRLNHFSLNIPQVNYKGFAQELFRYLKILNKI